VQQRLKL